MKKNTSCHPYFFNRYKLKILSMLMLIGLLFRTAPVYAEHSNQKRILIINSYHYGFEWSDSEMEGFLSELPADLDIYTEFMDTKRNESDTHLQMLFSSYLQKYIDKQFDLIVTFDDPAFEFALAYRDIIFPDTPLLFIGVNNFSSELVQNQTNLTGIVEVNDFEAINTAIQLYPTAKQIYVISDNTINGNSNRSAIEELSKSGRYPIPVNFLNQGNGLTVSDLLLEIKQIPQDSIIYYSDFFMESNGDFVDFKEFLPLLSKSSNAPIFVHSSMYMGYGVVGGKVGSGFLEGQSAGNIARQILEGEPADSIPINDKGSSQYQFDYLQLQRWGISTAKLPPDSLIINRQTTFYEENKAAIWGVLVFLVFQTSIIFLLLVTIKQRKKTEAQLMDSESRYRSIFEENPSIQIIVEPQSGQIFSANPAAIAYYGYSLDELTTMLITSIDMRSNETIFAVLKAILSGELNQFICKHRLRNGDLRDVEVFTGPITINDELYLFATIHDVSERMEREREMEIIAQLAIDLRNVEKTNEMYDLLIHFATTTAYSESAILAWKNSTDHEFKVVATQGATNVKQSQTLPDISAINETLVTRKSKQLDCSQETSDLHLLFPSLLNKHISIFPLFTGNEVVGILTLKSKWALSHGDIRSLSTVCEIVASSTLRSQLFDETRLRVKRLDALHTIDKAITTNTRLELTLDVLLEQVIIQLGVDAARILLYQPSTLSLETIKLVGFRNYDLAMRPCRIGVGLSGQIAAERKPLFSPNINNDATINSKLESNAIITSEQFQSYFGIPLISKGQLKGILEVYNRKPVNADPEWFNFFETLSRQTTIAVDEATLFENLERTNIELTLAYDTTLEGWARALELRDYETKGHSQRVTDMTIQLARKLKLDESEISQIRRGALLHDIGKMGIPDHILHKPGPLTNEEWEIMQKHPIYAFEMLSRIAYLRPALDIPYYHHEKWDGSGYPFGLKATQIPLPARIFAMVDVWDALASDRPYRKAWTKDRIQDYLLANSGTHFDPQLLPIFLELLEEPLQELA